MLRKVRSFPYEMPLSFSPPLALLITEVITQNLIKLLPNKLLWYHITTYIRFSVQLLCKTPIRRLRTLERFKRQTFFHGTTFDLALLQRQPVEVTDGCFLLKHKTRLLREAKVLFPLHCPGDPGAERETGPGRQSPTRPHFVPAAPQGFWLRLVPQPPRHTGHTAGCRVTHSHGGPAARPGTPTAACSGKRPTQGSVCVTDCGFTVRPTCMCFCTLIHPDTQEWCAF